MFLPPELWAVLLYAGQIADAYTTRIALESGVGEEANPIARWYIEKFGTKAIGPLKSAIAGAVLSVAGFFLGSEIFWAAMTVVSWVPPIWNYFAVLRPANVK